MLELHRCPRKFELDKLSAANATQLVEPGNIHFAFGHALGAGVQEYLKSGNLVRAQFAAFLAWTMPADAEEPKSKKSLPMAIFAIEKLAYYWKEHSYDQEYELYYFEPTGLVESKKPAIELSASIDFGNGYIHYVHIDLVLRHKRSGKLAVFEIKSTGSSLVDAATYANSNQGLGYSVVLDKIAADAGHLSDYEVLYFIYNTKERDFTVMPFVKSKQARAEWLQDTLLDHAAISTYQELAFFPKRGESCIHFNRRCKYFGSCGLSNRSFGPNSLQVLAPDAKEGEVVDFHFTLAELVSAQRGTTT